MPLTKYNNIIRAIPPDRGRSGVPISVLPNISADVILTKELKRPIRQWHAFLNKGIDSCLAFHHAA
jgi:hypothetical protein